MVCKTTMIRAEGHENFLQRGKKKDHMLTRVSHLPEARVMKKSI